MCGLFNELMKWAKVFSREYSVQYCELALHSTGSRVKHLLNKTMIHPLIIPENKNECFYFESEEKKEFLASLVAQFSGSKETFSAYKDQFHRTGLAYLAFCQKVHLMDVSSLCEQELKELYQEYFTKNVEYCCIGPWVGFLLTAHWTEQGMKLLRIDNDKVKEALFRPIKKSTVLLMQEEAAKVKKHPNQLEVFWKKYQWLPCLDIQNSPWTLKEIKKYISELKVAKKFEQLSFEEAAARAKLSNEEKELFQMIKELGYIKDARDDYRRQGIFYIQSFFAEIARRMKLSLQDIAYLTEAEIISFLDSGTIDLDIPHLRREKVFLMHFDGSLTKCRHQHIEEKLQQIGFVYQKISSKEIKGRVACKGFVRGRAVIVRTVHDILKVKKGDVLVAVTTHPDYVPAMQKAAAIVTDEGGLLSHAAIVSRELGIPCIVGTGNATSILDNGLQIEVNAEEGIVKIIK